MKSISHLRSNAEKNKTFQKPTGEMGFIEQELKKLKEQ